MERQLPETYCGVQIGKEFGLDNLVYREDLKTADITPLANDDVLVKVIGTQLQDYFIFDMQGHYPISAPGAFPGYETAGVIVQVGSEVPQEYIGRYAVMQMPSAQGGFCEYAKAPLEYTLVFDKDCKHSEEQIIAAGIANPLTAYGIREKILDTKAKVIVNMMGGSNIMRYIFKMFTQELEGYRVLQVIRNPAKVDDLKKELGTDNVIATGDENFLKQFNDFIGESTDVAIVDSLGGENTEKLFKAAPSRTTLIVIEYVNTTKMTFDTEDLLWKEKNITGFGEFFWFPPMSKERKAKVMDYIRQNFDTIFSTNVTQKYKFSQLGEASKTYLKGIKGGKIICVPDNQ